MPLQQGNSQKKPDGLGSALAVVGGVVINQGEEIPAEADVDGLPDLGSSGGAHRPASRRMAVAAALETGCPEELMSWLA